MSLPDEVEGSDLAELVKVSEDPLLLQLVGNLWMEKIKKLSFLFYYILYFFVNLMFSHLYFLPRIV